MTSSTRTVLFVLRLVLIALTNPGYAYGANPLFAAVIFGLAGFPFRPAGEMTRPMHRRETVMALCVAGVFMALLIAGALSGFTKVSNDWFESSGVRVWFAGGIWIALSVAGWRAFRAGRFLAQRLIRPRRTSSGLQVPRLFFGGRLASCRTGTRMPLSPD